MFTFLTGNKKLILVECGKVIGGSLNQLILVYIEILFNLS